MPLDVDIVLRQIVGRRPALPPHVGQRRAQHAAIHGAGAGAHAIQVAKHAHAQPAAMALHGAHGLVVLAICEAQVVAQRSFLRVADAHAGEEHAVRGGSAGRVATAARGQAGVAEQQAVATGNDSQLRQRKRRRRRHAGLQDLAREKDRVGKEVDGAVGIGQPGTLQHRLAHFVDDAVAARQRVADDIEHAGAGPVEKVTAKTIAAAAVQRIGRLQHGEVSGRHAQIGLHDAILAAVRIAVAHARMEVPQVLALRRIVAAMCGSGCRMREGQVEQQIRRDPGAVQARVGPRQRHGRCGGKGAAASEVNDAGQQKPDAAGMPAGRQQSRPQSGSQSG